MCFALLMAAVSFFLGQAQVLPELLRNSPVPALIPVVVVILMFYWILRVQWSPSAPK
jgi:NADH:ubiquinone oxidoreductase subunit 6 (subunit J)